MIISVSSSTVVPKKVKLLFREVKEDGTVKEEERTFYPQMLKEKKKKSFTKTPLYEFVYNVEDSFPKELLKLIFGTEMRMEG